MGVFVRTYIDILTLLINFPYSTCISSFLAAASLLLCSFLKCFFGLIPEYSDERGFPLTQYLTNARISRDRYSITHLKHPHRVLRLISNTMSQFRCAPREVKYRHFAFLFFLFFSSGPTAIVFYLLALVYM